MKEELDRQNSVSDLPDLNDYSFENIFNMYKDDGIFYAYNIIKTVKIPPDLHNDVFDYIQITGDIPWTTISFNEYGTIRLWWLLCVANKILNPVKLPEPGTVIKVIRPQYVRYILDEMKNQDA